MLKIENLTKYYGERKVVDNLSLLVEGGDIFGFIGENGAGKTTTLKSIVGIHDFDEGDIFVNNYSIKKEAIHCKKILAYLPDNPNLYEYLTGNQYINFVADLFKISIEERKKYIDKYANLFEITGNLGYPIASYSHGMKQKIAVISALIHSPKLLVLDEPFVGLDPKATYTLKQIMSELSSSGGAVFFSTHGLDVAQNLCNKIAIIKKGKLIVSGDTKKLIGNRTLESFFMEVTANE